MYDNTKSKFEFKSNFPSNFDGGLIADSKNERFLNFSDSDLSNTEMQRIVAEMTDQEKMTYYQLVMSGENQSALKLLEFIKNRFYDEIQRIIAEEMTDQERVNYYQFIQSGKEESAFQLIEQIRNRVQERTNTTSQKEINSNETSLPIPAETFSIESNNWLSIENILISGLAIFLVYQLIK